MAYNNSQGSKYEETKDLPRAALKALILGEIKAEMKAGRLPKCRVSMREGRGVGTMSLRVTLAGLPFKMLNPERVRHDECEPNVFVEEYRCPRYTAEAVSLRDRVSALIGAYNYDRSEIETDYFNVRFYLHVDFNGKDEAAERRAIISAASPLRRQLIERTEFSYRVMNDLLLEKGLKPDKYGPGEPEWFAQRFDRLFARFGLQGRLTPEIRELKAKIATADDWAAPARRAGWRAA